VLVFFDLHYFFVCQECLYVSLGFQGHALLPLFDEAVHDPDPDASLVVFLDHPGSLVLPEPLTIDGLSLFVVAPGSL